MVQLVGVPLMNKVRTFRLPPRPLSACLYDKTPPRKNVVGSSSTAGVLAIVHFGSVGRLCGLFERSKAT